MPATVGLDPAGLLVAVVAGQAAADVLERQPARGSATPLKPFWPWVSML